MATEYDRVIQPLTEPMRTNLAEIQATVADEHSASEAWELLAARGLIPLSWINSNDRGFVQPLQEFCEFCDGATTIGSDWPVECESCQATGLVLRLESNLTEVLACPPDVQACIAIASMADAIVTAEVLVRQFVDQLAKLGFEAPLGATQAIRWRIGDGDFYQSLQRTGKQKCAIDDFNSSYSPRLEIPLDVKNMIPTHESPDWEQLDVVRSRAMRVVRAHASWEVRSKLGERLRSKQGRLRKPLLADCANPYTVALEVCALGLAIEDVTDGVAFMLVPPIERR